MQDHLLLPLGEESYNLEVKLTILATSNRGEEGPAKLELVPVASPQHQKISQPTVRYSQHKQSSRWNLLVKLLLRFGVLRPSRHQ